LKTSTAPLSSKLAGPIRGPSSKGEPAKSHTTLSPHSTERVRDDWRNSRRLGRDSFRFDRDLSDRLDRSSDPRPMLNRLPPGNRTCWFWFQHDRCKLGAKCRYEHRLTDHLAPTNRSGSVLKIVEGRDMRETRRLTLEYARNLGGDRSSRSESHLPPDAPLSVRIARDLSAKVGSDTETPILDLLIGKTDLSKKHQSEICTRIWSSLKARAHQHGTMVTDFQDDDGKWTRYSTDDQYGLRSKLSGIWSQPFELAPAWSTVLGS